MQPRLSISPTRRGPRPASAKTRSNFASSSNNAALGTKIGTSASVAAPQQHHQGGKVGGVSHLEDALVTNLKQQVSCLELEVKYLKTENDKLNVTVSNASVSGGLPGVTVTAATPAAATNVHASFNPAVDSSVAANMEMLKRSNAGSSLDFRANHGDLLSHAHRLEQEVVELRERFAVREQEHALEMAGYKGNLEVGGLSRAHGAASGFKVELEHRADAHQKEIAQLKDQNAQECVSLKKTIDRLQMEYGTHASELEAVRKSKDAATKEIIALKDALRTNTSDLDTAKRQLDDTMNHLKAEQEKRRQFESKEQEVRKQLDEYQNDTVKAQQTRVAELERQLRDTNANLHMKTFENEQLKVTTEKLNAELMQAANNKADLGALLEHNGAKLLETENRCKRLESSLADSTSERDFYKLSTDRLKVEHSVLEVKLSQMEAKVNSDRAGILTLEKQYCSALEQNESLKRESKTKEDIYRSLDSHDDNVRRENKILGDENDRLTHTNKRLDTDYQDLHAKYEAVRGFAEQAKAESQIMTALHKLDKTKHEMASMVQTQMKLAHEVSNVVYEMPDTSSVTRAMSPQAAEMHHNNNVSHNTSAINIAQATPMQSHQQRDESSLNGVPVPVAAPVAPAEETLLPAKQTSSILLAPANTEIITPMAANTPSAGDAVTSGTPVVVNAAATTVGFETTNKEYIPVAGTSVRDSTHSASEWN